MTTTIRRVGDELCLVIPAEIAAQAEMSHETEVEVTVESGRVIIHNVRFEQVTLDDLLAKVTDDNRHATIDWGPPVGRELL